MSSNVWLKSGKVHNLLGDGATTVGAGVAIYKDAPFSTFQAVVTGTGAVTADVDVEVSNDGTNWLPTPLGSVSLSGSGTATDGFGTIAPWKYVRANVTSVSGTGATVQVYMGV